MPAANSTESIPQIEQRNLIVAEERRLILLDATWEISGLTSLIAREAESHSEVEILALRGVAMRIKQLNLMLMQVLDEENVTNLILNKTLKGV